MLVSGTEDGDGCGWWQPPVAGPFQIGFAPFAWRTVSGVSVDGRIVIVALYQIHIIGVREEWRLFKPRGVLLLCGDFRERHVSERLGVDGRIDIVALYQIHIVGVRSIFPRFDRSLGPLWS